MLVQTVRTAEKSLAKPVSKDQKLQILEMIEDKSFQNSQQIILRELGVAAELPQRSRTNGDGSLTITLTLTPEQAVRWQQVAELTSHAVESQNPAALLDYLTQKEIARRTEIKRASPIRKSPSQNPRMIAPNMRKVVMQNAPSIWGESTVTTSKSFKAMTHLKSGSSPKFIVFADADPDKDLEARAPKSNHSAETEQASEAGPSAANSNSLSAVTRSEDSDLLATAKASQNKSLVRERKVMSAGCNYHDP